MLNCSGMGNEKFVAQGEPVSFGQSPYPYLEVAKAHTAHAPLKELSDALQYPVSWEKDASEAVYENNLPYLPWYARHRVGAPHTWHAAELLLYLMDCEKSEGKHAGDTLHGNSCIRKSFSK